MPPRSISASTPILYRLLASGRYIAENRSQSPTGFLRRLPFVKTYMKCMPTTDTSAGNAALTRLAYKFLNKPWIYPQIVIRNDLQCSPLCMSMQSCECLCLKSPGYDYRTYYRAVKMRQGNHEYQCML